MIPPLIGIAILVLVTTTLASAGCAQAIKATPAAPAANAYVDKLLSKAVDSADRLRGLAWARLGDVDRVMAISFRETLLQTSGGSGGKRSGPAKCGDCPS